jgi:ABC-type glutathione transport system ATPase component
MSLIRIKNLNLFSNEIYLLKNIDFELSKESIHTLVGGSGSGKSSLVNLFLGFIPENFRLEYDQFEILGRDFYALKEKDWLEYRRKKISFIPQSPAKAFHPYLSLYTQIREILKRKGIDYSKQKILEFLEELGIRDPKSRINLLPKYLSGGEKQRVIIKLATLTNPEIFLADEPTTALDSINEKEVLELILKSVKNAMVFITHDRRIIREISDSITVLKKGELVEKITLLNQTYDKFHSEYTRKFIFN